MYFAPPFTDRHESEETAVQQIAKRVRRKKVGGSTSTAHSSHNSHPAPAPHSSSSSSSSGSTHGHSTTSHGSGTPASQPAKPSSSSAAAAGAARPAPVQLPDHSNSQAATHAATPARLPHVGEKGFTPAGWAVKGQERNQQSMAAVYLGDSAVLATMVCVAGLLGGASTLPLIENGSQISALLSNCGHLRPPRERLGLAGSDKGCSTNGKRTFAPDLQVCTQDAPQIFCAKLCPPVNA